MSGQDCEQLTLFPEDSPASRSVSPGSAEARRMTVTSGLRCSELLKKSGPLGLLEKTLLESSIWRSTRCYLTWKTKDTKQGRLLFRLAASTPRTGGTDAPLWHTPTANDGKNSSMPPSQAARKQLVGQVMRQMMWTTPCASDSTVSSGRGNHRSMRTEIGGQLNPTWVEWLMGFPLGWTDLSVSETP